MARGRAVPGRASPERLRDDLLARFREERIEPPGDSPRRADPRRRRARCSSGGSRQDRRATAGGRGRRLEQLIRRADGEATAGLLAELKSDPGKASLNTILEEIDKLERVRALGLPAGLFADCSEKLLGAWRARAAAAYPSDLRAMPQPVRLTLLAVLCWSRTAEITDALVDLLIEVVDKIRTRAENRVEGELVPDLKRVRGKHGLLFALAEAARRASRRDGPRGAVSGRAGGDAAAAGHGGQGQRAVFHQRVRKVIRGSYSNHYRRMLPRLLDALEFRCSNTPTGR